MKLEKYKKSLNYSYTFGAFPTIELIKNKAEYVIKIVLHSKLQITKDIEILLDECKNKNITVEYDDKLINRLADKENVFVLGVFKKFVSASIASNKLVLVNPSDMGNIGTIMRTMLGFNIKNLAVVKPAVDYFNPKAVRASMGAIFSLNIIEYESCEDYLNTPNKKYMFMLNGQNILGNFKMDKSYDLVFGNEASGLKPEFFNAGQTVRIAHSNEIDSLNLPISVGIALYERSKN